MIDALHSEVHRHKLNNGSEPHQGCTNSQSCESGLSDRSIPNPRWSKLINKPLRNLISTMIVSNLFSHQKHLVVSPQLLLQSSVQCLSISHFLHCLLNRVFFWSFLCLGGCMSKLDGRCSREAPHGLEKWTKHTSSERITQHFTTSWYNITLNPYHHYFTTSRFVKLDCIYFFTYQYFSLLSTKWS